MTQAFSVTGAAAVTTIVVAALLAVCAVLLTAWAVRLRGALSTARSHAARLTTDSTRLAADNARLTAEAARLAEVADGHAAEAARLAAVRADFDEAARRERSLRDSVQASFESVARNVHAMATVQQQVLDGLGRAVSEAPLMAQVMAADHAAAQMTRKAQTLLVMCGIWPARRETRPVTLFDCVRGAQSRIVEFGRVDVHGGQSLYAMAPAVEGLMHSVAELLENATVFSPSRTQVAVSVREVAAGAVIEIDDAGLGMPPDVLRQATAQLRDELDLAQLGAVPRLGLACVGRWSRELGFGVELSTASAYGGTRVVVFVPHRLLTEPTLEEPIPVVAPPRPAAVPTAPAALTVPTGPTAPTVPATPAVPGSAPAPARTPVHGEAGAPAVRAGTGASAVRDGAGTPVRDGAGAMADGGQEPSAGAAPQSTPGGLPQRRSRRRQPGAAYAPAQPPRQGPPASPAVPRAAERPWTPEAAGASVASVVQGTRRGRAQLGEAAAPPGAAAPEADSPTSPTAEEEGGR
ncbi:ATP-binding protein [Streptomyces varsoviensis]|uniref:ATP-binding protein n=1 Tax=Streptomyces varsoviensis TaxID=67373 RepID=UPI0006621308|nr:ATP-binding protein [Streptomyces varsoviensis]